MKAKQKNKTTKKPTMMLNYSRSHGRLPLRKADVMHDRIYWPRQSLFHNHAVLVTPRAD